MFYNSFYLLFFFHREIFKVPWPITMKFFPHGWKHVQFYNPNRKIWGSAPPQKKIWWPKTC